MPGKRRPEVTPYAIPFTRAVAARAHRRVVFACGSQMGKTDGMLDVIGHRLDQRPAPILYVGPTRQFLNEQFEPRVVGLLDEAPSIRAKVSRGKRMTKTRKVINGVPLRLAHAGSSTALKSDPASLALTDEADELMANVKGQGNPLTLIDARGDTYADFVHAITSTPGEGAAEIETDPESGLEFWGYIEPEDLGSTIWGLWQAGTAYHWAWPCQHCDEFFIPRFRCLEIPRGSPSQAKAGTFMACPRCGGLHNDADHKEAMNARGVYVAKGQAITKEGEVVGEIPDNDTVSFWVSGLCSPFRSWGDRASSYVEALRTGDPAQIQGVMNGAFGEVYAQQGGDAPAWVELVAQRKQPYLLGEVPREVLYLTCAVDVQKNRLVYEVKGHGARAGSWLIEHGEFWGSTAESEVWSTLSTYLLTPIGGMHIRLCMIDAGYRPNKVDSGDVHRVYAFCRQHPKLCLPTKGASTKLVAPLVKSRVEVTPKGARSSYGLELIRVDTDHWKSFVHSRVAWPEDQPGGMWMASDTSDDYFQQLVSEARVKSPAGKVSWHQRSKNNHYLDTASLNAVAGYLLNVQKIPEGTFRTWDLPAEEVERVVEDASAAQDGGPKPPVVPAPGAIKSVRDRMAARASRMNK